MSKKIKKFLVCILCGVMLTGCEDVIELTEEQSHLIAEYAADILLKYDLNYENRILEGEREAEKISAQEQADVLNLENTQEQTSEEDTEEEVLEESVTPKNEEDVQPSDDKKMEQDIAKIVNKKEFSITYQDYAITKQYPSNSEENEYIFLDASDGYELFVAKFQVKNVSKKVTRISMMDLPIKYRLVCNHNKMADSMLTILMDDLTTLDISLKPDEEQQAVLVFQIAENMKNQLDAIQLKVYYDDMENVINIK